VLVDLYTLFITVACWKQLREKLFHAHISYLNIIQNNAEIWLLIVFFNPLINQSNLSPFLRSSKHISLTTMMLFFFLSKGISILIYRILARWNHHSRFQNLLQIKEPSYPPTLPFSN